MESRCAVIKLHVHQKLFRLHAHLTSNHSLRGNQDMAKILVQQTVIKCSVAADNCSNDQHADGFRVFWEGSLQRLKDRLGREDERVA